MSGFVELVMFIAFLVFVVKFLVNPDKPDTKPSNRRRRNPNRFGAIPDRFSTLEQVTKALQDEGVESCNLIIGIDFTKSNEWNGRNTFGGKCLHAVDGDGDNPYMAVVRIIGATLASMDDDGLVPAFGFGDARTRAHGVFSLHSNEAGFSSFEELLQRYQELAPQISLAGPTSFAPLIRKAVEIVQRTKEYHILLIVADGQVTEINDTVHAIREASNFPLSIVMVGVGDGPWDGMEDFDDNISGRRFDNFQFVDFNKMRALAMELSPEQWKARFAVDALMEIPDQFHAISRLGLLSSSSAPPPVVPERRT